MNIKLTLGVLVATAFVVGVACCSAQELKILVNGKESKSSAVFNAKNGHYYEYVGEKAITWPQAKDRAESRVLQIDGKQLRGYLVTLTDKHEQELLEKFFLSPPTVKTDVWMGGSDELVEGEWRWITGPEAREDGGKGKLFFRGRESIGYTNWGKGEPNNSGGKESFLQWHPSNHPMFRPGIWIDQAVDKASTKGFFVEYSEL